MLALQETPPTQHFEIRNAFHGQTRAACDDPRNALTQTWRPQSVGLVRPRACACSADPSPPTITHPSKPGDFFGSCSVSAFQCISAARSTVPSRGLLPFKKEHQVSTNTILVVMISILIPVEFALKLKLQCDSYYQSREEKCNRK